MIRQMLIALTAVVALNSYAHACAGGPDAYRVVNVSANDVLNVRSGPGLEFSVIGVLPSDAVNVRKLDQVPLNLCDSLDGLSAFEKKNIWTKVLWEEGGSYVIGWAKSRFLAE